ncbi:MAG: deoxyribonuclease IV [SAR202 cluster bacterium]|nr:deoxyribonuclease IV [SAR202 cluster bacterium]
MRIGAHVSTAGGLSTAFDRAQAIGAEAIQIFASSPRAWAFKGPSDKEVALFKEKSARTGISPVFLHGSYLVNLGGNQDLLQKCTESLTSNLTVAAQIGANGVIFHSGSHKGVGFDAVFDQVVGVLSKVISQTPESAQLIIENCAGSGDQIGDSFKEVGRILHALKSPRVKVCLDTQHAFAAGYNVRDRDGLSAAMGEFDREIGLGNLSAVHANDSKGDLSCGVDRHENIGDGFIGYEGFAMLMGHPAFKEVPFLLEVPGIEDNGPDRENVDRLKAIRKTLELE